MVCTFLFAIREDIHELLFLSMNILGINKLCGFIYNISFNYYERWLFPAKVVTCKTPALEVFNAHIVYKTKLTW